MKVVVTQPWGERFGGAENLLWTFLRTVDRQRIEPIIVFFRQGRFVQDVARLGIRTLSLPGGRMRRIDLDIRVIVQLADLLRRERPALLLNWGAKTQIYGALAALIAGMENRVVWWQQGIPCGHWLDRLATILPSRAIGCYSQASCAAQARQWPSRHTFVIHPGIEEPRRAAPGELGILRSQLGIPAPRVVVGLVGRLEPAKGHHRFLEMLAELRRRGHKIHGLVVGDNAGNLSPGYDEHLDRLVDRLELQSAVTFTGRVPEVGPYLQLMDILVHAAKAEPFGLVLVEAMALAVPVVAFNAGGPAEIVEQGTSGMLVSPDSDLALVDAVEKLAIDRLLRQSFGKAGQERFRQRFSATRMAVEMERALQDLSA